MLHGAQNIDAGLCSAGGVLGVEIISIEVDAAVGAGLVYPDNGANQFRGGAEAVVHGVAQVGGDFHAGLAQDGGTVRAEADSVIPGVAAAEDALADDQADGQAVGNVIEVAVDASHHPVPIPFQLGGHVCHAVAGGEDVAISHQGGDFGIGSVCN